jgi:hypothetical protein
MNPAFCYIFEVASKGMQQERAVHVFHCPQSGFLLHKQANYWWSNTGGCAHAEIEGISCLRANLGALMSWLQTFSLQLNRQKKSTLYTGPLFCGEIQ